MSTTSLIQTAFPSTIGAQPHHITILTTKTAGRKNQENNGQTGAVLGQASACATGGGGYLFTHSAVQGREEQAILPVHVILTDN